MNNTLLDTILQISVKNDKSNDPTDARYYYGQYTDFVYSIRTERDNEPDHLKIGM